MGGREPGGGELEALSESLDQIPAPFRKADFTPVLHVIAALRAEEAAAASGGGDEEFVRKKIKEKKREKKKTLPNLPIHTPPCRQTRITSSLEALRMRKALVDNALSSVVRDHYDGFNKLSGRDEED
jgi:hypothetical protein